MLPTLDTGLTRSGRPTLRSPVWRSPSRAIWNSGSEVGSSDLVEPGFGGVDNFRFILCLGPRHEGRHHHQRRASEVPLLRSSVIMPGQEPS